MNPAESRASTHHHLCQWCGWITGAGNMSGFYQTRCPQTTDHAAGSCLACHLQVQAYERAGLDGAAEMQRNAPRFAAESYMERDARERALSRERRSNR